MFPNLNCALTGGHISKSTMSDFICDQDFSCFIRCFQVNNVNPLSAIKTHLSFHMLKSSDALYLLTLSANANVEANSVGPDKQQSILSSLFDPEAF